MRRCAWANDREAISYGTEARQVLDVYSPAPQSERPPIVVFFYGGSWQDGNRGEYRFVADALTSRGYITVVPDYRVYPEYRFPAFVEDGARAFRWVLDHAEEIGGDPERVYLMGHSAGAHIAAMLALDERYLLDAGVPEGSLAGTIALAGPYAFYPSRTANVAPVFAHLPDEDLARPITFVDGNEPPFLLLHGAEDTVPAYLQALLEHTAETMDEMQHTMAKGEEERARATGSLEALTERLGALTE